MNLTISNHNQYFTHLHSVCVFMINNIGALISLMASDVNNQADR